MMNKNAVTTMVSQDGTLRHVLLWGCLFLCVLFLSASGQNEVPTSHNTAVRTANPSILIARQESNFKMVVAQKVKALLEGRGIQVTMVDMEQLEKHSLERYHAVVIINEVRAWHLSPEARNYVRNLSPEQRRKVVLVSTAKGSAKFTKGMGVDALTAASEMDQVSSVAADIVEKVAAIISIQQDLLPR